MKVYDSYMFRKQFRPFCAICDEESNNTPFDCTFNSILQSSSGQAGTNHIQNDDGSKPPGWWSELGYTIPFFISWFSFASTWLNMMTTWSHNHVWSNYHEVIRLTSNSEWTYRNKPSPSCNTPYRGFWDIINEKSTNKQTQRNTVACIQSAAFKGSWLKTLQYWKWMCALVSVFSCEKREGKKNDFHTQFGLGYCRKRRRLCPTLHDDFRRRRRISWNTGTVTR